MMIFQTMTKGFNYKQYLYLPLLLTNIGLTTLFLPPLAYSNTIPDAQQSLQRYKETFTLIRKGENRLAEKNIYLLKDYPLIPYLEKALLYKRIHLISNKVASDFIIRYQNSVPEKHFRKKWLAHLAQKKRWQDFLQFYESSQANLETSCHYLQALHETGQSDFAFIQTPTIWLSERSLPKACDLALQRWQQAGLLTDDLIWQRSKLAIKSNNYTLANYLKNNANPVLKKQITQLISIYREPKQLLTFIKNQESNSFHKDMVLMGLEKLAENEIDKVIILWPQYQQALDFNYEQQQQIKQIIGRQLIASAHPGTIAWIVKNDPNSEDDFLLEWRILLAIKNNNWSSANRWIALLPVESQLAPQWQYWAARCAIKLERDIESAKLSLSTLAKQRHYYGFMAAELLGQAYAFENQSTPNTIDLAAFSQLDAIKRSQAFYEIGEIVAARREWHDATHNFSPEQYVAVSVLAQQWGWHQQAIMASTKASYKDDLNLRFPLAYLQTMLPAAKASDLQAEWLYAIARQESAFANDAVSPIGAKGLMQLRPNTAKEMAKEKGLSFQNKDIYDTKTNILLGSHYLQQLLGTFQGNRILATAAYNAGPYRVKRWLAKQTDSINFDIWIETLPYYETRNYIKNVLASSVIYGHRLGYSVSLINEHEQIINNKNLDIN